MIEHHNNNTLDTFINKLKVLGFDIAFLEGGFQTFVYAQNSQFNKTIMTPITEPFGFNARWDLNTQTMYYSCQQPVTFSTIISIREYKSDAVLWAVDADRIDANCEYWIIPINKSVFSYENDPHFTGVKICIYNKETG